ncbi:MAG: hypothetical protein KC449_28075, partial [Anaerolineales bacterium]|nr:hypothetical protein [Anaerolineales bacterium]
MKALSIKQPWLAGTPPESPLEGFSKHKIGLIGSVCQKRRTPKDKETECRLAVAALPPPYVDKPVKYKGFSGYNGTLNMKRLPKPSGKPGR